MMRPFATFRTLQQLPGGAGVFRLLMLASFRMRELQAGILSRLAVLPGVPVPVLRWLVGCRERLIARWQADLSDLRHLEAVLTMNR
jgi:hypothetical protein